MDLEGTRAVVTGASSGIGRGIALELAAEGASVAVGDLQEEPPDGGRPTADVIRGAGGEAIFREMDVSDADDAEATVEAAVDEFGGLDVLVNNAGIALRKRIDETDEEEWNRVLDVNLTGIYQCSRFAVPHLRESDGARIVNVASQLGLVGRDERGAYCASKGGVVNLTRAMAMDYAEVPILVNAICPGIVRTNMTAHRFEEGDPGPAVESYTPLPYAGESEDIGRTAAFLASDGARYITGASIVVDGGYTAW